MDIREAIIQEAEAVILRTGFYDLHYKEISERTGVLPSEIHYLFPSKYDLGCTVIQRARISFKEWTYYSRSKREDGRLFCILSGYVIGWR